jgi:hypothetical protein
MNVSPRTVWLAAIAACLCAGNAFALPALEGIVKGADGRGVSGAEVRVQTTDSGSTIKIARSDAAGRYNCSGMTANVYRVSLVVNGAVKASIKNVKIALGDATQLNFELKQGRVTPEARGKHYIWVPTGTGSHIAGRWVEVDDRGNASANADPVDRRNGGELIRRIQDNTTAHTTH